MEFNELIAMKKSYKKPQEGDVFVLQPIENIFFWGKVIETNVKSRDSFVNGMTLIFVYQCYSHDKVMPPNLDSNEFLIAPMVVNYRPWNRGYFETIGNVEVSQKERNTEIAFRDVLKKEYVDISGNAVESIPKLCGTFGLGSYGAVGKEVHKALKNINIGI